MPPTCDRCERRTHQAKPVEGIRTKDPGSTTWRSFLSCCGLQRRRLPPPLRPYQAAAVELARTSNGLMLDCAGGLKLR